MLKNILKAGFWAYILFLTVSLLVPVPQTGEGGHMDKVIHAGVFTIAGILMVWAYNTEKRWLNYLIIYSIAIECAQGLTSYRSFDFLDLLANSAGILFSRIIVLLKPDNEEMSEVN